MSLSVLWPVASHWRLPHFSGPLPVFHCCPCSLAQLCLPSRLFLGPSFCLPCLLACLCRSTAAAPWNRQLCSVRPSLALINPFVAPCMILSLAFLPRLFSSSSTSSPPISLLHAFFLLFFSFLFFSFLFFLFFLSFTPPFISTLYDSTLYDSTLYDSTLSPSPLTYTSPPIQARKLVGSTQRKACSISRPCYPFGHHYITTATSKTHISPLYFETNSTSEVHPHVHNHNAQLTFIRTLPPLPPSNLSSDPPTLRPSDPLSSYLAQLHHLWRSKTENLRDVPAKHRRALARPRVEGQVSSARARHYPCLT